MTVVLGLAFFGVIFLLRTIVGTARVFSDDFGDRGWCMAMGIGLTGLKLIINIQVGVLIGEDPTISSPRSYVTSYDKGTTLWSGDKRLADVMLLEDTDAEGDMVWLVHVWWYERGRGLYKFVGGTGKWEGIRGEGTTLPALIKRTDDYHFLRSEVHWRIDSPN